MFFLKKKNKPDVLREKIRELKEEYRDLDSQLKVDPDLGSEFEKRYMEILEKRIPLETFIADEYLFLEKIKTNLEKKKNPAPTSADRVIDEQEQRISGYPEARLKIKVSRELSKLHQALLDFISPFFPVLLEELKKNRKKNTIVVLEENMYLLLGADPGSTLPKYMKRYESLLALKESSEMIMKEEQNCLLQAGTFLHKIKQEVQDLMAADEEKNNNLEVIREHLEKLIKDFRLYLFIKPKK